MKCTSYLYDIKIKVMKTAMQELLDDIEKHIKVDWPMNKSIRNSISKALEKEKEQIFNAYVEGLEGLWISAEEYYNKEFNQTYNQKETRVFGESDDKQFWSDKPNQNK